MRHRGTHTKRASRLFTGAIIFSSVKQEAWFGTTGKAKTNTGTSCVWSVGCRGCRAFVLGGHENDGQNLVGSSESAGVDLTELHGARAEELLEHDAVLTTLPGGHSDSERCESLRRRKPRHTENLVIHGPSFLPGVVPKWSNKPLCAMKVLRWSTICGSKVNKTFFNQFGSHMLTLEMAACPRTSSGLVGSSIHSNWCCARDFIQSIASSTSSFWLASVI